MKKCPICGKEAKIEGSSSLYIDCPNCGTYIVPSEIVEDGFVFADGEYNVQQLKHYMYYHNNKKSEWIRFYLGTQKGFLLQKSENPHSIHISIQEIENWYPRTFAARIDSILIKVAEMSDYYGNSISIDINKAGLLFFVDVEREEDPDSKIVLQADFYTNYLNKKDLIEIKKEDKFMLQNITYELKLLPEGWNKIYELQKNQTNNKDVFVAMSFAESTKLTREAIRDGIVKAGYSSIFLDEIIDNHQIIPEMMRLIKESRFLIMDITEPNYGAYYEAGYAEGLGKEVIITCKQETFNRMDFSCDKDKTCTYISKALKPHFDIAQKRILVWNDEADLIKKLSEWIKSIIGNA